MVMFVMMSKEEKKLLIKLICNEQTDMIIKDHTKYESDEYKKLEALKVRIKDIPTKIDLDEIPKGIFIMDDTRESVYPK